MPSKVISLKKIVKIRKELKKEGKKVVFTNGCFDILHKGHVHLLKRAKKLGDILIVGLNSDSSVKRIKGEKRPIFSVRDRAFVLSSIDVVDYIVIFNEDTPLKVIKAIEPDVLVKGADWDKKSIVGREIVESLGGKVVRIPVLKGFSTTSVIEKLLRLSSKNK
jgi:D-beta-D-heptose 7-phosphate kinase/D-beta-D-heptose 1-phosphate adenosyltransferase